MQGVLEVKIQAAQRCTASLSLDGRGQLRCSNSNDISFFTSKPSETFRLKEKYAREKGCSPDLTRTSVSVANCHVLSVGKSPETKEV